MPRSLRLLLIVLTVAAQLALVGSAAAAVPSWGGISTTPGGASGHGGGSGQTRAGFDISWPQCGTAYPANSLFGIVGVNGGKVFSANPCLAGEIAWAGGATGQLYANTGNPGPALSSFWPSGQTSPRYCDPANPDTADCAYDYGFNAAQNSYADATAAYAQLRLTGSPATTRWWFDVETGNSWRSDTSLNISELQGEVAYFHDIVGVSRIGFYSTQFQWNVITGGSLAFNANPSWVAGASSLKAARNHCSQPSFTGNVNLYTQYPYQGFDANNVC